jgi:hypothetical protein
MEKQSQPLAHDKAFCRVENDKHQCLRAAYAKLSQNRKKVIGEGCSLHQE